MLPRDNRIAMLWSYLDDLSSPCMQDFYLNFLKNSELVYKLCSAKASHHDHHNYEGGLFDHSCEVADLAATIAKQFNLSKSEVDVCIVGGLLHDLGKIELYYNDSHGVGVQHEACNFMLLSDAFFQLKYQSTRFFEALFSCMAIPSHYKKDPYWISEIVNNCDRLSSSRSHFRQAFANQPYFFWYTNHNGKIYKRLF